MGSDPPGHKAQCSPIRSGNGNVNIVDQPRLAKPGRGENAAGAVAAPGRQGQALAGLDIVDLLEAGGDERAAGFAGCVTLTCAGRQCRRRLVQDHVELASDREFSLIELGVAG